MNRQPNSRPSKAFRSVILVFCFVLSFVSTALCEEEAPVFENVSVHDPSIILADDGYYYIYGSHMAAARSLDLMRWEAISTNAKEGCTLFEDVQTELKDVLTYCKSDTFWAPDVCQLKDGRYYLYYCACEGSSPLAMLGVAVSDSPQGPFTDLGVILKSGYPGYDATRYPNVVDPDVFYDQDGRLWMVYGSYSGGIFILELDENTGFPFEGQGYGKKLLGKNHARIEGPYILFSPDTEYYYLFLSFGGLTSDGGYNIRVCRSKTPDGPYYDALGQDMTACGGKQGTFFHDVDYEGYGVKLMGGYQFKALEGEKNRMVSAYRSPGHNSAIYDEKTGRYFLVFHTRFANNGESFSDRVHQFFFNDAGWPVVAPYRYAGETLAPIDKQAQQGVYKVILHQKDINTTQHVSIPLTLQADGTVAGEMTGTWQCDNGVDMTITLAGIPYQGKFVTAYETMQNVWTTTFTALSQDGQAVWGSRSTNP